MNLLEIFDGDIPVILYLEDTKQKLAAPRDCTLLDIRSSSKSWSGCWARKTLQQNDIFVHEWHRMRRFQFFQVAQIAKIMRYTAIILYRMELHKVSKPY